MYRQTNFQTTSNIITFDITKEEDEPHKDITFELTIGQHPMAVRVFLLDRGDGFHHPSSSSSASSSEYSSSSPTTTTKRSEATTRALSQFAAMNRGLSITNPSTSLYGTSFVSSSAGVMFYANDTAEQRICDYRHQVRVRSKNDASPTRGPGEIFPTDPLLQLSAAHGKLYMAIHSPEQIRANSNVALVCYLDPPRSTVPDKDDDFYSIWRIATHYVVSPTNQAAVVNKLRARQHLMDDSDAQRDPQTGLTPLHVIGMNASDPAFAKLLLSTGWKAFDIDLEDTGRGETPLIKLLQRPAVHDPEGPWHFRTIALMEVFVKFAGATLGVQSKASGDTATHLAVRYHDYGGKILPFLLSLGGGHSTILSMRNANGLTPEDELNNQKDTNNKNDGNKNNSNAKSDERIALSLRGFLKNGKDEALKLLKNCDKELLQERAMNRFKVRGLPIYTGGKFESRQDTGSRNDKSRLESLKVPVPSLVVWDNELPSSSSKNSDDCDAESADNCTQRLLPSAISPQKNTKKFCIEEVEPLSFEEFNSHNNNHIRKPVVRAKLVKLIFEKYDTDKDGFISRNALLHAIHSYDSMGLPQEAVDYVVDSIGICSDGRVNVDEFALILLKLQARG